MEVMVGDRMRSWRKYGTDTLVTWEYTVTAIDRDGWASADVSFLAVDTPWTHELIARPAPPEPTGLMAVVEVDGQLFTHTGRGTWVDSGRCVWSWKGMTNQYNPSPKITVLYEGKDPR